MRKEFYFAAIYAFFIIAFDFRELIFILFTNL